MAKYTGSLAWDYVTLRSDMDALTFFGEKVVTLPEGTVLRVYSGSQEFLLPEGKQVITTPNKSGVYLVETLPDDKSKYWSVYPDETQYEVLLSSDEYKDSTKDRGKHLYALKIKMEDGSATLLSNAMKEYYDKLRVEGVEIPKPGDNPTGSLPSVLLAVGLGIGAALVLGLLMRDKPVRKVKNGARRRRR